MEEDETNKNFIDDGVGQSEASDAKESDIDENMGEDDGDFPIEYYEEIEDI
jgi:hypothetical protein